MAVTINASTSAGLVNTADTSGVLQLQTAGTTAVTVDASQNVGIGTASPASKLDVTATIRAVSSTPVAPTSGKGVEIWYETSGDYGRIATYDRTGAAYKNQYFDSAALYINSQSAGKVGIGTSSPALTLSLSGGTGTAPATSGTTQNGTFRIRTAANGVLDFGSISASGASWIQATDQTSLAQNYDLLLNPNGGNLLVGTTSAGGAGFTLADAKYIWSLGTYNNLTAAAANMVVQLGGSFARSTSALKYKQDIRDLEKIDINVFRAVRYKSNLENDDQTKDHFGVIADEVDAAGITELVNYGADGEVEGFQYERLTVVLLKAMQTLKVDLDATKAELAALKGTT